MFYTLPNYFETELVIKWQKSRLERGKVFNIRNPPDSNSHPYPSSKQEASDEAEDDKGGNFGRIARAGILDEYTAKDLEEIQKRALEEGIPYQTMIASILHKYVSGRLVERHEHLPR